MSLFDHVVPSERAADLALVVRRIRKRAGLDVVPMLVVEGRTDEPALGALCVLGEDQVWSAGDRSLVEQLSVHLNYHPIEGCACVYLVDCDGRGKTAHLRERDDVIVTKTCDIEGDLLQIGVATRVCAQFCASVAIAEELVRRAIIAATPVSRVRRAAHRAKQSMKLDGRQVTYAALPEAAKASWAISTPSDEEMLRTVGGMMGWTREQVATVAGHLSAVPEDPHKWVSSRCGGEVAA